MKSSRKLFDRQRRIWGGDHRAEDLLDQGHKNRQQLVVDIENY